MGKLTYKGLVPRDDPMFSTGPEIFSRLESSASSTTSANATTGATPSVSNSAIEQEQVDEKADGEYRIAKYFRNNPKLRDELLDKMRKKED
jgi:hypothetical protein